MPQGPLAGIRVVEFAGLGPAPFAAMVLADMGADVIRIDRPDAHAVFARPEHDLLNRGRRSIALDLKAADSRGTVMALCARADVLIEGFRPGVLERLGYAPEVLQEANPGLVVGRMTGWGQHGALAGSPGHDINYIAMAGALHPVGDASLPPPPPINFVGDFGGGAMVLVSGVLAALVERQQSGRGQVIDAAMVDGAAMLTTQVHGWRAGGLWTDRRGTNLLDGGSYFYRSYTTLDRRYIAVGAIEPQFHRAFIAGLGLSLADFDEQLNPAHWPGRSARIAAIIATRSRDDWIGRFAGSDACVSPVLTLAEAIDHPVNRERGVFGAVEGIDQPMSSPRFSRTPGPVSRGPCRPGEDSDAILAALAASADWPAD